jgi:spore germination protein GerM
MKFTFNLTNKNILKKILAISLPVCVVGASITTYIVKTKNKENSNLVNNEVNIKNGVKRQVYLVTEDNLLTPITIVIENKELLTDEIASLVNLLKEDSEINHAHFKGVLPNNCDLKNVTIDDKTITLNFNENFNNYNEKLEKRLLESLVWTTLQFDGFDTLKLQVNDVELTSMPLNNTPFPSSLTKSIGINNQLMTGSTYEASVNVFYEKTIDKDTYYVPVSIKVNDEDNIYKEVISGINTKLPLYTSLKTSSLVNKIEVLNYNELDENNNLNLTLSNKALYDEKTIDNKVFDFLVMNLKMNDQYIDTVSITIDDEIINVNGYENNVIEVNAITFNEIKI